MNKILQLVQSIFLVSVLAAPLHSSAQPPATLDQAPALREIALQIRTLIDRAEAGPAATADEVAVLGQALQALRDSTATTPALAAKYRAVSLLLAQLKSSAGPANRSTHGSRTDADIETVSAGHGATCASALGIAEHWPVEFNLAQGKAETWLRFQAHDAGLVRFTASSSSADPAIGIFRSCLSDAAISANDDSIGLDASAWATASAETPLFVRVTNSGPGGTIHVGVQGSLGSIAGHLRDAQTGAPVIAQILLFDATGNTYSASTGSDQNGDYSLPANPGSYLLEVLPLDYVALVYPHAPCLPGQTSFDLYDCDVSSATPIAVQAGATVAGIDFALEAGLSIAGRVQPPGAQVLLRSAFNGSIAYATVYANDVGRYRFSHLAQGTFKLAAIAQGYGSQMFDHVACASPLQTNCDFSTASPIQLTDHDVIDVDFALPRLASITGVASSPAGPLPQGLVHVSAVNALGTVIRSAIADSTGKYTLGPLDPDTYYVTADASGFFSQIYSGLDCPASCAASIPGATPVVISQTGDVKQADFSLHQLPKIFGHVHDATSGAPLSGVTVEVVGAAPRVDFPQTHTVTGNDGSYAFSAPVGQYYLYARSADHIDRVYPAIACEADLYLAPPPSCDLTGATILTISPGGPDALFDFTLDVSASISGHAYIAAGPGSDLPVNLVVAIVDANGNSVAGATTDSIGNYVATDLPAGTYYAFTTQTIAIEQIWQGIDCPGTCDPISGTPIVVGAGAHVDHIDFNVVRPDAIVGKVVDGSGMPIEGAVVDLFDATGGQYQNSGVTDASGYYAVYWSIGDVHFLATDATGYLNQVYANVPCPLGPAYYGLCPFTNATPVTLVYSGPQAHVANFVLQTHDEIFASGFE